MVDPFESSKYRVITVSGRVANGATTLSKALAMKLNWKLWNGGEIYRQYSKENGIPLEKTSLSTDEYHLKLDEYIREKIKIESQFIVESWLAGFDARELPGVFKILVLCSDDGVRIDRIVNRDNLTIEEAKEHLKTREQENLDKWERLYHTRDFWNPNLYDLIIDTYKYGPNETLEVVLRAIGYYNNKV